MGNCLETKLKSIVNNDNLEKVGKFNIIAKRPASLDIGVNCNFKFAPVPGRNVSVVCSDGTACLYDANDSTRKSSLTMTANYDAYLDNSEYKKFEITKYDIERMSIRAELKNFNVDTLQWIAPLRILNIFQDSPNSSITGNIVNVVANTDIVDLTLWNTKSIKCNIGDLGNYCSQLVSIRISDYEGTFNDFVAKARIISTTGSINAASMPYRLADGRVGSMGNTGKLEWTANNFTLKNISAGGDIVVEE